ncbi:MAG: hypothetical protein ACC742_08175 [Thermoanaerobaculales bacterium]
MPQVKWFLLLVILVLAAASPALAQEWSGSIGGAYFWQDVDGSEDSFRTQTDLQGGFVLEDLNLLYRADEGAVSKFTFDAWGFGDASPTEAARLGLELNAGFSFFFDYDRRQSFFNLAGSDLSDRADSWDVTRFKGELVVDAWRPVRISLVYRSVERDGGVTRPHYGLNELYPLGIDLEETMTEAALRLETRTLPVRIQFEQALTNYERRNRPFAAGSEAIGVPDPDLLDDVTSDVVEQIDDVPTTRLVTSYSSRAFEGVISLLWRSADLDVNGTSSQTFLVGGGDIGTMSFIDKVLGSAAQDTFSGALSFGFRLGRRWTLRLAGDYRDGSQNSSLTTQRLLRVTNPDGGVFDFGATFDDSGVFDLTDSSTRLTLEYKTDNWSLWAGGGDGSREVRWRISDGDDPFSVKRDATSYHFGTAWNHSEGLSLSLEFERGDFEKYVFRTNPESVDRTTLKLRSRLGRGWRLDVHGRYVTAKNPPSEADLDYSSRPFGVTCSWSSADGGSTFGVTLERYNLETETSLVMPDGDPGLSVYDLDLETATVYGHTKSGIFGLSGALTYLTDKGTSWPVDSWTGNLRVTVYGDHGLEYSALAQYWSYDEANASLDDFDVLRYGLAVNWRFE